MMDEGMDKEMDEKDEMMSDDDKMEDKDDMMSDEDGMMAAEIMLMEEGSTPYTVVAGDTLGSISRRAYGSSQYWAVICSCLF